MIVTLVPLSYVIYPAIDKVFPLTPLRKIALGFRYGSRLCDCRDTTVLIDAGETPNISWQLFAYAVLTASGLWFQLPAWVALQAPTSMKSAVMAVFLFSVSRQYFTAGVNKFILVEKGDVASVTEAFKALWDRRWIDSRVLR